ncbi:MAG: cytochrome c [Methyloprofundus sp.]|nr:cytochrome c [Methyloprofundus sp.]
MTKLSLAKSLGFIAIAISSCATYAETNEDPMVLREIMQGMQLSMQQIEQGIAEKDWDLVSQNAFAIADHPAPPLLEKLRIFAYINTDLGEFKELDKQTHGSAKELAELALREDKAQLQATFTHLQESCVQCHEEFRAEFQAYFYEQN